MTYNPGGFALSRERVRAIHPELFGWRRVFYSRNSLDCPESADGELGVIADGLRDGATQPAIVVSAEPFVIAVYSDELDAVVFLRFAIELGRELRVAPRRRMVACNTYGTYPEPPCDVQLGPWWPGRFNNVRPYIADLIATSRTAVEAKIETIPEALWQRAWELAACWYGPTTPKRDGRPRASWQCAYCFPYGGPT